MLNALEMTNKIFPSKTKIAVLGDMLELGEIEKDEHEKLGNNLVKNGFDRAMSTILDANITTLIAAVLLFAFGSGPIRGFSITLSLGVIASMFTALMLTNFLVYMYLSFANKKGTKGGYDNCL